MKLVWPYWSRYSIKIAIGMLCLILGTLMDLLVPTIVSRIIDEGVMYGDLDHVLRLGAMMLVVTAVGAVFTVARCVISSTVSQNFGADLRVALFAKINRLSYPAIGRQETASLITRMTNDTAQLVGFTNSLMRMFLRSPVLLVGAVTMTVLLNPRLALVLTGVIPLIALLMYISMKVGFPLFTKLQEALDANNAVTREYLSGVRVVKAYNTFEQEVARFDVTNTALAATATKAQRMVGIFFPIISFAVNAGLVLTLWMAREWVAASQMQVGQIIAFLNYMMQISMALGMLFNVYQMLVRARASAVRVGEVLAEPDAADTLGEARTPDMEPPAVIFENVSFTYPHAQEGGETQSLTNSKQLKDSTTQSLTNRQQLTGDAPADDASDDTVAAPPEPVLRGVSFTLPAGKILGVIGPTGSGKTSLVQLIPDLYAPTRGTVRVGELDTTACDHNRLRANIAYVAQSNTIFYGTIADNIRMGKTDASDEEIEAAARAACAHDFITAYADGYETVVGQKGVNLSGGQKQRVGIARALVRKAPLLILDDCVSAVDIETEARIMHAISNVPNRPTIVMITQRISSVMNLEHILVMDDGTVAGYGSHDSLMRDCEVYREIYHSQLL